MTTEAFHNDFSGKAASPGQGLVVKVRESWRSLGWSGRRYTLTGIGTVGALCAGLLAALMVRLPSDMSLADTATDQAVVQTELPSEAQARAYALQNPPAYAPQVPADVEPASPGAATIAMANDDPTVAQALSDDETPADTPHPQPLIIAPHADSDAGDSATPAAASDASND